MLLVLKVFEHTHLSFGIGHFLFLADKASKFGVLTTSPGSAREHHSLKGECISTLIGALQTANVISLDELDGGALSKVQDMAGCNDTDFDKVKTFFRPSAAVSWDGLVESCTCRPYRCCAGLPPPQPWTMLTPLCPDMT